jgi:hypothetical protein
MAVPIELMLIAVGEPGDGVFAAVVVMFDGTDARLVCAKPKAPPKPPIVVTCNLRVGILLSPTPHVITLPGAVARASKIMTPVV